MESIAVAIGSLRVVMVPLDAAQAKQPGTARQFVGVVLPKAIFIGHVSALSDRRAIRKVEGFTPRPTPPRNALKDGLWRRPPQLERWKDSPLPVSRRQLWIRLGLRILLPTARARWRAHWTKRPSVVFLQKVHEKVCIPKTYCTFSTFCHGAP